MTTMAYRSMTDEEWLAFLVAEARPAVLATVRRDGSAHAAPIWIDVDDGAVWFNTGADTIKGRNLARTGAATICVQDDRPPFSFVMVEGTVELIDDIDLVRKWAARIGGRYMGRERAEEYGARNGVPGELLVKLIPTNVVSAMDVAS
jgi:PPOX class probable F420-dependent enzyme